MKIQRCIATIVVVTFISGCCHYEPETVAHKNEFKSEIQTDIFAKRPANSDSHVSAINDAITRMDQKIVEKKKYKGEDISDVREQLKTICMRLGIILENNPGLAKDSEIKLISQLATNITAPCEQCLKDLDRTIELIELYTKLIISVLNVIASPLSDDVAILTLSSSTVSMDVQVQNFNTIWEKIGKWVTAIDQSLHSIESIVSNSTNAEKDITEAVKALAAAPGVNLTSDTEKKVVSALSIVFSEVTVMMTKTNKDALAKAVKDPTYRIVKAVLDGFAGGLNQLQQKTLPNYRLLRALQQQGVDINALSATLLKAK